MSTEPSGMPINGGLLTGLIAYGLVSAFVTGPVIGERTIDKSGWEPRCEADLHNQIMSTAPERAEVPRMDCMATFGMFVPDPKGFCKKHSDFRLDMPIIDKVFELENQAREKAIRRIEDKAARSSSRCSCATRMVLEEERVDFALYAGTARLVTPPSVRNLEGSLEATLSGPLCGGA